MIGYAIAVVLAVYGTYRAWIAVRTPTVINASLVAALFGWSVVFACLPATHPDPTDTALTIANLIHDLAGIVAGCAVILLACATARTRPASATRIGVQILLGAAICAVLLGTFFSLRADSALSSVAIPVYSVAVEGYALASGTAGLVLCLRGTRVTRRRWCLVGIGGIAAGDGLMMAAAGDSLLRDLAGLADPVPVSYHSPGLGSAGGVLLAVGFVIIVVSTVTARRTPSERAITALWRSLVRRDPTVRLAGRWRGLPVEPSALAATRRQIEIEDALAAVELTDSVARWVREHADPAWALGTALRDEASLADPGTGVAAASLLPEAGESGEADRFSSTALLRVADGFVSVDATST